MADLGALIERLEKLEGPDREVDGEIMFSLFAKPVGQNGRHYLWPEDNPSWSFAIRFPGKDAEWFRRTRRGSDQETILVWRDGDPILMNDLRITKITASIDAAVGLVERVLPGCNTSMCWGEPYRSPMAVLSPLAKSGRHPAEASGPTPAIALCLALCRSLLANRRGE